MKAVAGIVMIQAITMLLATLQRTEETRRAAPATPPSETLDEVMRAHILDALHATHWVVAGPHGAAARLGMKRSTLTSRMAKLGIVRSPESPLHACQAGPNLTSLLPGAISLAETVLVQDYGQFSSTFGPLSAFQSLIHGFLAL